MEQCAKIYDILRLKKTVFKASQAKTDCSRVRGELTLWSLRTPGQGNLKNLCGILS